MAADVRTLQYLITLKAEGSQQVVSTLKTLGIEVKKVDDSTKKLQDSSKGLGIDIGKLASRAAVTIPIWLAMREAFMFLIRAFSDGLKYISDLDKALTRIQLVTTGVSDLKGFLASTQKEIEQLARTTGRDVTEISEAFYKFGTAGIEGQRALEGMTQAVRTASALQGESGETATLLADAYKLLGDSLPKTIKEEEKLAYIGSTLTLLEKENTFTIHEMSDAFHKFAPVAANMNISLDEMLALLASLHTLGIRGSEAGTSLARAFLFLEKETQAVSEVLGRAIDVKVEDKFNLYMELVKKLNEEFQRTGDVSAELRDIFGMKAITGTGALIKAIEVITKNLDDLKKSSFESRKELENTRYNMVIKEIENLTKANGELLKQVTGDFWKNALGGIDNYKAALSDLSIILQSITPILKTFGDLLAKTVNFLLVPVRTTGTLLGALSGAMEASIGNKNAALKAGIKQGEANRIKDLTFGLIDKTKKQEPDKVSGASKNVGVISATFEDTTQQEQNQLKIAIKMKEELTKKLDILNKENQAIRDSVKYTEEWQVAESELKADISSITVKYTDMIAKSNQLPQYAEAQFKALSEQQILLSLMTGDYSAITDLIRSGVLSEDSFLKLAEKTNKVVEKQVDLQKKFLDYKREIGMLEIESSSIYGKSTLEIEKAKLDYLIKEKASIADISQQHIAYLKEAKQLVEGYGNTIKSVFGDAFKNVLTGAESPTEAFDSLMVGLSDSFATALTDRLTKTLAETGLFEAGGTVLASISGAFGGAGSEIATSMTMAGSTVSQQWTSSMITSGQQVASMWYTAITSAGQTATSGKMAEGTSSPYNGTPQAQSPGMLQYGMAGLMGGLSGYAAASRGGNKGMGYAGAAIGGIGAMLSMNPATAPLGMVMSAVPFLMGLFGKKKTETTVETRETSQQVSSRIDVTNKQLQLVNRNLIALRSTMETYILPESAYFASKVNLEDQFSLSARRGGG